MSFSRSRIFGEELYVGLSDDRDKQQLTKNLLRRLRDVGVVVEIKAA